LGRFIYWVPVLELLNIFAQNLQYTYITEMILLQRALYTIYILEDVIGSDVCKGQFFGPHYISAISVVCMGSRRVGRQDK